MLQLTVQVSIFPGERKPYMSRSVPLPGAEQEQPRVWAPVSLCLGMVSIALASDAVLCR